MMNDFMVLMVKLQYIAFEPLLVELVLFTCGRKEMVGREYMTLFVITCDYSVMWLDAEF